MRYGNKWKKAGLTPPPDALAHPKLNISKKTDEILKEIAREKGVPLPRLLAYLVDNALNDESVFDYTYDISHVLFRDDEYLDEALKIEQYLSGEHFKSGTDFEMLILCRRDMGIDDKEKFLLGYRRLLYDKRVEESRIGNMHYVKPIPWVKLAPDARIRLKNRRYKDIKPERSPLHDADPESERED